MKNPDESAPSAPAPEPEPASSSAANPDQDPDQDPGRAQDVTARPAPTTDLTKTATPAGPATPATPVPGLPAESPAPTGPAALRASDADRDKVADLLREALAEGRLTPQEHADRIDAVYTARTYAELEPILEDLPTARDLPFGSGRPDIGPRSDTGLPVPPRNPGGITAIFAGAQRKGRWLVEPHTNVLAVFGGAEVDLRQAVLSQRDVTINIVAIFGGVEVTVPPGVQVIGSGTAILGGWQLPDDDPLGPDAPVIRFTGLALFGGVDVKRETMPEK